MKVAEYLKEIVEKRIAETPKGQLQPSKLLWYGRWSENKIILKELFGMGYPNSWVHSGTMMRSKFEAEVKGMTFHPECIIAENENPLGYIFIIKTARMYVCFTMLKGLISNHLGCRLTRLPDREFVREYRDCLTINNQEEYDKMLNQLSLKSLIK